LVIQRRGVRSAGVRLIARATIEDKVLALNACKAKLFASVIDDGNAFSSALTANDIRELIS
jgi:SNF2 family DNA or RNA helicase